jgi:hypothetical protein
MKAIATLAATIGFGLFLTAKWCGAAEPTSNAARCIYIVESDGTFVAVCAPKAGGK